MTETPADLVVEADPLPERPWWAPLTLLGWISLVVCGYIGTAVAPRWANTNPELLLLLHARVRHLLLVAGGDTSWWAYGAIGAFRLALAYAVCHLIGRAYGNAVLVWFGKYLGVNREQIHQTLAMFHKSEWFVVPFFAGSNVVAAITGISKMPARRLIPMVAIGLAVRLPFWWGVAWVADDQVDSVLDFLNTYQKPALIVSIVLTVVIGAFNVYRGRDFEL